MNPQLPSLRYDLQIIASWIEPGAKVIDLGCGEGNLLRFLKETKQVRATGIEKDEAKVSACIELGLPVLQGDVNQEVLDYSENAFDYVILSQTLQQVYSPDSLLEGIVHIGKKAIVSFPIFSHWLSRFQLMFSGLAPVTKQLPYEWYDTPNIRVVTLKDFRRFSKTVGFNILKEVAINTHHEDMHGRIITFLPNLFATYGVFLISDRAAASPSGRDQRPLPR